MGPWMGHDWSSALDHPHRKSSTTDIIRNIGEDVYEYLAMNILIWDRAEDQAKLADLEHLR